MAPNGRSTYGTSKPSRQPSDQSILEEDEAAIREDMATSEQEEAKAKEDDGDEEDEEDEDEAEEPGTSSSQSEADREIGSHSESEADDTITANGNFAPSNPKADAEDPTPKPAAVPPIQQSTAANARQIQDLQTKLALQERKRDADREELKDLERLRSEKSRLENIVQKLNAKLKPQHEELTELRRSLKESQAKLDEFDGTNVDQEATLEEAYLDREMAEEVAEARKAELDAVKEKLEELQLEVEVLREENEELGTEMSPEERNSQGWLQKLRENERLTEALLRLRDYNEDQERDFKSQLANLEGEVEQFSGIQQQCDEAKEKLRISESVVESLKEQLEDALGAEQTIEEFAAQNEELKQQMEDLRISIRDLEDIRELNDELEINHVEAEKQMQDELDYKDSLLSDQERLAVDQDAKITDYEYTTNKFREVVSNLQNHIQDLSASKQLTEAEAEDLNDRSKAMNDLNMKLQSSAAKTQMNTMDLELKRLEAQEAIEHLAIVQMFLPDSYTSERDSVLAYLRFIRVAAKARLLHSTLKSKINNEKSLDLINDPFSMCDVLDKLVWIAAMCVRFVGSIRACLLEDLGTYTGALHDMEPVERGLNAYIDAVKKDELKEGYVAEELQRSTSLMTHLAEVHILGDGLADYAEDVLMRTILIQSYLENTATALAITTRSVAPNDTEDQDNEDGSRNRFISDANALIAQSRSAKVVAGKAIHALKDLKACSMSINTDTSDVFHQCQDASANLAALTRALGETVFQATTSSGDTNTTSADPLQTALTTFTTANLPSTTSTNPLPTLITKLKHIATLMHQIHTATISLPTTLEFTLPPTPWTQRAHALRTQKTTANNTEAELTRLRDSLSTTTTTLRARDHALEESAVKIELLESRTRDAHAKAARIAELSTLLEAGKGRERELATAVDAHARDVAALAGERDRWKRLADERTAAPTDLEAGEGGAGGKPTAATARELESLNSEINGLQAAVRYLRRDNQRIRLAAPQDESGHMSWLSEPLLPRWRRHDASTTSAAKETEDRQKRLQLSQEGRIAFSELRSLISTARLVDLTPQDGKTDRLAHRPLHQKPAYIHAQQAEAWEAWRARSRLFVELGREALGARDGRLRPRGVRKMGAEELEREKGRMARDAAAFAAGSRVRRGVGGEEERFEDAVDV